MHFEFIPTRHVYDSYQDFWKLVDLAGFPKRFVDQIQLDDEGVFICTPLNGEHRPHVDHLRRQGERKGKIVLWILERPGGEKNEVSSKFNEFIASNLKLLNQGYVDYLWTSDRNVHAAFNDSRVKYVIFGSHNDLVPGEKSFNIAPKFKKWDVAPMSYLSFRRTHCVGSMIKAGVKVAPNAWGDERAAVLRQSKFMLNVHQDWQMMFEPLRIAVAAASGIPIISENFGDGYPLTTDHYIAATYHKLLQVVLNRRMANYIPLANMGRNLNKLLCEEHTFKKCVEKAVSELSE